MKILSPNHKTNKKRLVLLDVAKLRESPPLDLAFLQIVAAQTDQRKRVFNAKPSLLAREILEPQFMENSLPGI